MKTHVPFAIFVASLALTAAACSASQPARFYTLSSTAVAGGTPPTQLAVLVEPVSIPEAVDRPQMVVQVAPNRVDIDEFNRWAAPLSGGIARAVAGDLVAQLGTPNVAVGMLAGFDPAYRVTIDIQRFELSQGQAVEIDALWTVRASASGSSYRGRTLAREAVEGNGFAALASASSGALAKISGDIAGVIRRHAGDTLKREMAHP